MYVSMYVFTGIMSESEMYGTDIPQHLKVTSIKKKKERYILQNVTANENKG